MIMIEITADHFIATDPADQSREVGLSILCPLCPARAFIPNGKKLTTRRPSYTMKHSCYENGWRTC